MYLHTHTHTGARGSCGSRHASPTRALLYSPSRAQSDPSGPLFSIPPYCARELATRVLYCVVYSAQRIILFFYGGPGPRVQCCSDAGAGAFTDREGGHTLRFSKEKLGCVSDRPGCLGNFNRTRVDRC